MQGHHFLTLASLTILYRLSLWLCFNGLSVGSSSGYVEFPDLPFQNFRPLKSAERHKVLFLGSTEIGKCLVRFQVSRVDTSQIF